MPLARFTKLLFQRFQFSSLILKRYLRHFFRASIPTIFVAFLGDVPLGGFHFLSSISRFDFIIVPILRCLCCQFEKNIPYQIIRVFSLFISSLFPSWKIHFFFCKQTPVNKAKRKLMKSLPRIEQKSITKN